MKIIVNTDSNWAIGKEGKLINRFPEDMKMFRDLTMGKTIIYGRKTLESFPGMKPLPGRRNIVITSNPENIPRESTLSCNYYASIRRTKSDERCALTSITFNESVEEANVPKENTSLISVNNIELAVDIAKFIGNSDDTFVIGGERIYRQMIKYCDTVYLTYVYGVTYGADAFFPNMIHEVYSGKWTHFNNTSIMNSSDGSTNYEFITYKRKESD